MTYRRVIPRDLFNEASLLKCCGRLALLLDKMNRADCLPEDVARFDIDQSPDDGSISIENMRLRVDGVTYRLWRPLNSRHSWPLYASDLDNPDADAIDVFDDHGELTPDMTRILAR